MSHLGVYFDYKKDSRYAWIYTISPLLVNIILIIASIFIFSSIRLNLSTLDLIRYFGSYMLSNSIMVLTIISFISLLCVIRKRFMMLNTVLKFVYKKQIFLYKYQYQKMIHFELENVF